MSNEVIIIIQAKPNLSEAVAENWDMFLAEVAGNLQTELAWKEICSGIDDVYDGIDEIYGNNESPFHENQIPKPVSPYSLTKINAEMLIQTYCTNHQKKFTNLRVFNFYGENMPEEFFIPQMINSLKSEKDFLMTKGEQVRDFLYVSDVVSALILSAQNTNAYGETMNVCSGKGTKLSTLASAVNSTMIGLKMLIRR